MVSEFTTPRKSQAQKATAASGKKQTSLFSFFASPKGVANLNVAVNEEDGSFNDDDLPMDDDMLRDIEMAEQEYAKTPSKPVTKSRIARNKQAATAAEEYAGSETEDDAAGDDDDDADEDYVLMESPGTSKPRGRIIDDSDDDERAPPSLMITKRTPDNSLPVTPSKRQRLQRGISTATTSSDGPSLMSLLNGSKPPVQLKHGGSSLSTVSTASSSSPLMQRMQKPNPRTVAVTTNDARRERVEKFAKKNEERYAWLEDVKDAQGLRPTDPGYDKRTLFIPGSAWKKFSPFEKQYWEIKCKHWDTVGKFYELYENDASIGAQDFDLKMTDRVNMRMAGVPESSFDHWVAQFIAKGYKVARVDQLETKLAKDMRERGSSKKGDGLVMRELTGVLTAGTLIDPSLLTQDLATYCLAIVEATHELENAEDVAASDTTFATSFGIAFVDTATAQFHMCSIKNDDADRSGLETLLVQVNPREVVYVRGGYGPGQRAAPSLTAVSLTKGSTNTSIMSLDQLSLSGPEAWDGMAGLSQPTWRALKNTCTPGTDWIALTARKEFWDVPTLTRELEQAFYFDEKSSDMSTWPELLREAATSDTLALTAAGGLISYLRSLKLDKDLVSLKNFSAYQPMQNDTALVLDGPTIANLDLFTV
ncbi:DNA mismatch repair protein msh6, partial [Linderina macrospora]